MRGVLALVDDDVDQRAVQRRVQLGARRALDAVLRPRPALGGERAVVGRMPVARRDDEVVLARAGELLDRARRSRRRRHGERAAGREVVLEVDDERARAPRSESKHSADPAVHHEVVVVAHDEHLARTA